MKFTLGKQYPQDLGTYCTGPHLHSSVFKGQIYTKCNKIHEQPTANREKGMPISQQWWHSREKRTKRLVLKVQPDVSTSQMPSLWSNYLRHSSVWIGSWKSFPSFLSRPVKLLIPSLTCPLLGMIALQTEIYLLSYKVSWKTVAKHQGHKEW